MTMTMFGAAFVRLTTDKWACWGLDCPTMRGTQKPGTPSCPTNPLTQRSAPQIAESPDSLRRMAFNECIRHSGGQTDS